jgi:arginyl-tRNA synthetase
MIPGDIGAELTVGLRAAVAASELPASAAGLTSAGTWRPAPVQVGGGPGSYATSLPFRLAALTGREPAALAELLAGRLSAAPWISAARVTGTGYLTVTVTVSRLVALSSRIVIAGPAAARSDVLTGQHLTAPGGADISAAPSWEQAWRSDRDALIGRLSQQAGAKVNFLPAKRDVRPASIATASRSPVLAAVACWGQDAVRYALARAPTGAATTIERQLSVPLDLSNPFTLVSYAHADAASSLRWAADLGLIDGPQDEPASKPAPAAQLPELRLLDVLSWLPERVAAAARRRRPAELPAYLEALAAAWLDCRERCPALPFLGAAAPADPAETAARLLLADATRTALAAGLGLLAVTAPARL